MFFSVSIYHTLPDPKKEKSSSPWRNGARQILQHAEDEEEVTTVTAKEGGLRL